MLALSVQYLKPGHQIALREGRLIVNQASGHEIQCTATPVLGSRVERFDKSIPIDCQFVNDDADAQQKPWKRAGHASPSPAQAGELLCSELRDQQTVKWCSHGPRALSFEHGDLLSERKNFKGRVASASAEDADHREHGQDEFGHEITLVTRRNADSRTNRKGAQALDFEAARSSVYAQAGQKATRITQPSR
jgi:hypothetical protein